MAKAKKELHIIDYNGVMVADSREIAEILNTEHKSILSVLRGIVSSGKFSKEKADSMFFPVMMKCGRTSHFWLTLESCREFIQKKMMKAKGDDKKKYADLLRICDRSFAEKKPEISVKEDETKKETAITIPDNPVIPEETAENVNVPELLHVDYSGERPVVSGRELHKALEVKSNYTTWFDRMCEYGFTENTDFKTCFPNLESENQHGGQNKIDHQLTIPMAKELCMLQRNEKGKFFRQYFIKVEEMWNSPAFVMKRALEFANRQVSLLQIEVNRLEETVTEQNQQIEKQNEQIAELSPKAEYCDKVLQTSELVTITDIAKDFGKSAVWLNKKLHEKKVQFKQGGIWHLYQGYAEKGYAVTRTTIVEDRNGKEHSMTHTYWTQKGRKFIFDLLAEENIFPVTMQQIIMMPLLEQEEVTV